MRFTILGPLGVSAAGTAITIARPRRRDLLVYLLLHANQQVSMEQLVDALWGEAPPRSARGQVHTAVSALRQALGPDVIGWHAGGFRLGVRQGTLDVLEFGAQVARARELRTAGRHREAAARLREGLALWTGEPLAGTGAPFAEPARVRIEDGRVAAWELLADIELEAGRPHDLVPELTAALERHPAREPLCERLMLALHRSGRRADALAAARALRTLLADEYGLDVGPGVSRLEQAILSGDLDPAGERRAASVTPRAASPAPGPGRGSAPAGERRRFRWARCQVRCTGRGC